MPKNKGVENMIIDCLSFGGQEFRTQLTQLDGSCSGSLMRFNQDVSWSWPSELTGAGRVCFRKAYSRGYWHETSALPLRPCHTELCKCLNNMAAGCLRAYDTERKAEAAKSLVT